MSTEYDVIVIGAGPGGSNAAAAALKGGLSVVQVDRYQFPRMKPCGGGVTIKSTRALQLDIQPSLLESFDAIEFNVWHDRNNRFIHRGAVLKMVYRPEFDNSLVTQNKSSENFRFFDEERALDIKYDGKFHVKTDHREITGRQLIGADGAYSIVNKTFGIAHPKASIVAIEVNLDEAIIKDAPELVPCFDFGAVDHGYGWVFPKGSHLNVGLYTFARGLKNLRARLLDYIAQKGIVIECAENLSYEAHQIPVGGFLLRTPPVPVYIVGDAGGFADALTGEGIYHALESGRLAGEVAVQVSGGGTHRNYYRQLWRSVLPDTLITYYLSKVFYNHISKSVRILEHPLVWKPFVEGYASGATFTQSIVKGGYYQAQARAGQTLQHVKTRASL